jgi:hypothetical protein
MILLSLLMALQAPVTQQPAEDPVGAAAADEAVKPAKPKKEKIVCKAETRTGSRTNFRQICHTEAEWKMIHSENRRVVDKAQRERGWTEK